MRATQLRDEAVGLACCYAGMAVGIQIAILIGPPAALLAGCGPELGLSLSRLDCAACAGMVAGAFAHRSLLRPARPATAWPRLLAAIAAMLILHPPGTAEALIGGAPFAALHIAALMMPAVLTAHALVAIAAGLATAAGRTATRPLRDEREPI